VTFAFAPIDDGTRIFRNRARERMFGWWWIARSGLARADIRAVERPERDAAPHLASVGHSDDDPRAVECALRQAEHAADEREQRIADCLSARFIRTDGGAVERADERTGADDRHGGEPARDQPRHLRRDDLLEF
jgi:hypothetical protein